MLHACPFFFGWCSFYLRGSLRCQPDFLSNKLQKSFFINYSVSITHIFLLVFPLSPVQKFGFPHNYVFDHGILSPSFTIFRKDRDGRGGGVLLAIKNFIPCSLLHSPDHLEVVSVAHLQFTGTKLIGHLLQMGVAYGHAECHVTLVQDWWRCGYSGLGCSSFIECLGKRQLWVQHACSVHRK